MAFPNREKNSCFCCLKVNRFDEEIFMLGGAHIKWNPKDMKFVNRDSVVEA